LEGGGGGSERKWCINFSDQLKNEEGCCKNGCENASFYCSLLGGTQPPARTKELCLVYSILKCCVSTVGK
jgi:hypothetical protein